MIKARKDTKTAILDETQELVQERSISGVSFQELANRIGIKKGSMYYHFESKDALSVAMLKRVGDELQASFKRGQHKTAMEQLDYFLTVYSDFIGAGKRLCPGGAFAGEWGNLSDEVKEQVNRLIAVQVKGIRNILSAGIDSGQFDAHDLSLEELSEWMVACLQGALLTSRIKGGKKGFERSAKVIRKFLYKV